jgi:hypothetical protein
MPVLACHDEIVVECDVEQAEAAKAWLEKAMVDGMEEILNGHEIGSPRLPVKVEGDSTKSWAGQSCGHRESCSAGLASRVQISALPGPGMRNPTRRSRM